ncbi:MAG: hypothetical protein ACJARQ_001875 [Oleispira sp.]|jgi:hypothetical protein|tara:strand:- start:196 stop:948 length:753 start_codon:yes stop_codon:yes gene_type:complete
MSSVFKTHSLNIKAQFRVLISALLLSLLVGCSSAPQSSTGQAVYYALQTDVQLRLWVDHCQNMSGKLKQVAWQAKSNWWRRNGAFVEGADYGLTREIMLVSGDRDVTGANIALGITAQAVQDAEAEMKLILDESGNQEKLCLNMLSKFNDGDYDLRDNNQFYPTLVDLQRRAQQNGQELQEKSATLAINKQRKFGRSLYVVEKLAKRSGCPGANVKVIKSDWPHEVYDVQCPDNSYILVRCEWGNCLLNE